MAKRWTERFEFYQKALRSLHMALQQLDDLSELEKDGAIQRFEFTFELSWKTLQDYFQQIGYADVKGPRPVIKQAVMDGLIIDGHSWLKMLNDRNQLTHTYDEAVSRQILDDVSFSFLPLLDSLEEALARKL